MYLDFVYSKDFFLDEFGGNASSCVYYSNDERIVSEIEKGTRNLGKFSKINFFVGANNSGKSRFLRGLLRAERGLFNICETSVSIGSRAEYFKKWCNDDYHKLKNQGSYFTNDIDPIINGLGLRDLQYSAIRSNYSPRFKDIFDKIPNIKIRARIDLGGAYDNTHQLRKRLALEKKMEFIESLETLNGEIQYSLKHKPDDSFYLPVLRSIHDNQYLQQESFTQTIKENYGVSENVFCGLELFRKIRELKNSVKENRDKVEEFERFLSKHFFDSKQIVITSNIESKKILFSIDGEEREIHDIGDGIQSLIILLFPIFTAKKNDWFFIEEPETNLHPGLQRIFIETLLQNEFLKSKNLRYFFTTHSNHFLDLTLSEDDISIFQFNKKNEDYFEIKPNVKPSKETLDLLGVKTSSVFLANTSIWVEGPTDRKYISKLLKVYSEHLGKSYLKEDIDYAFFEYGGNLIQHYLFEDDFEEDEEVRDRIRAFSLSNKIYLLADNDNAKGNTKKGKRRTLLEVLSEEQENFKYQNTELTEIENLLPTKIVEGFLQRLVDTDTPVNGLEIKKSEYKKIGLGEYYEQKLINHGVLKKNHRAFRAQSGTLKNDYKIKLCDYAVESDLTYDDFVKDNPELKTVIEGLYNFLTSK